MMHKSQTIVVIIVSLILLFFPVSFFWIAAVFSELALHFFVPIVGLLLVALIGIITFSLSNKIVLKKSLAIVSVLIVLVTGSVIAENWYKHKYIPSITIGQQSSYYKLYMPFSDSKKLARLEGESDLKFSNTDELPVIDGATALFPVYCSFAESVYPSDCEIEKYVHFSKTSDAYRFLIEGRNDIIFVAQPSKEQLKAAEEAGIEFNLYPIGYEAFVFIVNQKNPVNDLSLNQIKDIYTGKITNWKDLGGKNQVIRAYQRDVNSGSQTAFLSLMGNDAKLLPPEIKQVSGMDGLIDVVADYQNHSNSIGYSFRYFVESMKNDVNVKILSINGIEANLENIRNKRYPVTDNFYAITVKDRESENTKKFIEWILSAQGQKLIEEVGYVPL